MTAGNQATAEFLHSQFDDIEDGWFSVCHQTGGRFQAEFFEVTNIEVAANRIQEIDQTGDVWTSTCIMGTKPGNGRGRAGDVTVVPGVSADIDFASPHRKGGKALPQQKDSKLVLKVLEEGPHGLTRAVWSGYGLHAYLQFEEPFVIENEAHEKRVVAVLKGWQRMIAGALADAALGEMDAPHNIDKILRPPGTQNHKDPKNPCEVRAKECGRRVHISDLESTLEDLGVMTPEEEPENPAATLGATKAADKKLEEALNRLGNFRMVWEGEHRPGDGSPSDACMSIASTVARRGWEAGEIYWLLETFRKKVRARTKPKSWFERTVGKALEGVPKKRDDQRPQPGGPPPAAPAPSVGFIVEPFSALLKMNIPDRNLLVRPWLRERSINMIFGPRGSGKTHFSLSLAAAIAMGKDVCGWTVGNPQKVMVVDGESDLGDLRTRISAHAKGICGGDLAETETIALGENLVILARERMAAEGRLFRYLIEEGAQAALRAVIPEDTKVIFFDNLSTLFGGNENDSEEWDRVQELFLHLKHALGMGVIFIHHSGKGGDQRGTSRREDALDISLLLDPVVEEGEDTADHVKVRTRWRKHRGFRLSDAPSVILDLEYNPSQVMAKWTVTRTDDVRLGLLADCWRELLEDNGRDPKVQELTDLVQEKAEAEGIGSKGLSRATVGRMIGRAKKDGLI